MFGLVLLQFSLVLGWFFIMDSQYYCLTVDWDIQKTSKGLYRSCAALASFSSTFDLILFEAFNFEYIVKKVWFGLDWWFRQTAKINGLWFALVCLI